MKKIFRSKFIKKFEAGANSIEIKFDIPTVVQYEFMGVI